MRLLYVPMTDSGNYTFLQIVPEGVAVSQGASLSDKTIHTIYKTIQKLSTLNSVRANQLFTLETVVPGTLNLSKIEIKNALRRLLDYGLIAQIFRLNLSPGSSQITLVPCFISSSPEEGEDKALRLFHAVKTQTASLIEAYLDSLPPIAVETIKRDMETDINSSVPLRAEDIPGSVVNIFSVVDKKNFEIVPPRELLHETVRELTLELVEHGKVKELENYGLLAIRKNEIINRFQAADEFILKKVIPRYKDKGNLKRELSRISTEESLNKLSSPDDYAWKFAVQRAAAIKEAVQNSSLADSNLRYPGALAVETVLKLGDLADGQFAELRQKRNAEMVQEFKDQLETSSLDGHPGICFVERGDISKFPAEVWQSLLRDTSMRNGEWHLRKSTHTVFIFSNLDSLRQLVKVLSYLSSADSWKILAFDFIFTREISSSPFKELFNDASFEEEYNNLIQKAALEYMPWYFRIFALLGLNIFRSMALEIAHNKLHYEQSLLKIKNRDRYESLDKKEREERREKMDQLKKMAGIMQIIEILDRFYMNEKNVPTIKLVRRKMPDIEQEEFDKLIREGNFQILPGGKEEDPINRILLYPVDYAWAVKRNKLRKVLDEILGGTTQTLSNEETNNVDAARRVQKYIEKKKSIGRKEVEPDGDPYQEFAVELHKFEENLEEN